MIVEPRRASSCGTPWLRDDSESKLLVLGVDDDKLLRLPTVPTVPALPSDGASDRIKEGHCIKVAVEVSGGRLHLGESLAAGHMGTVSQLSSDAVLDAVVYFKTAKVNILQHFKRMSVFYIIRFMAFRATSSLKNIKRFQYLLAEEKVPDGVFVTSSPLTQ